MIWHQRKAGILAGWDWGHGCLIKRHQDGTWGEAHRPGVPTKGSAALWAHPHSRCTVVAGLQAWMPHPGPAMPRDLWLAICVWRGLWPNDWCAQLPSALLSLPTGAPVFLKLRGGSLGLTVGLQTMQSISVLQVGLRCVGVGKVGSKPRLAFGVWDGMPGACAAAGRRVRPRLFPHRCHACC